MVPLMFAQVKYFGNSIIFCLKWPDSAKLWKFRDKIIKYEQSELFDLSTINSTWTFGSVFIHHRHLNEIIALKNLALIHFRTTYYLKMLCLYSDRSIWGCQGASRYRKSTLLMTYNSDCMQSAATKLGWRISHYSTRFVGHW